MRIEDKVNLCIGREGVVQSFELAGLLLMKITDGTCNKIKIHTNKDKMNKCIQVWAHPNLNKELFKTNGLITLKDPTKVFPVHTQIELLKWRYRTKDETAIPLICKIGLFSEIHRNISFSI